MGWLVDILLHPKRLKQSNELLTWQIFRPVQTEIEVTGNGTRCRYSWQNGKQWFKLVEEWLRDWCRPRSVKHGKYTRHAFRRQLINICSNDVGSTAGFNRSTLITVAANSATLPWLIKCRLSVAVPGGMGMALSITCQPCDRRRRMHVALLSSCHVSVRHRTSVPVFCNSWLMMSVA